MLSCYKHVFAFCFAQSQMVSRYPVTQCIDIFLDFDTGPVPGLRLVENFVSSMSSAYRERKQPLSSG